MRLQMLLAVLLYAVSLEAQTPDIGAMHAHIESAGAAENVSDQSTVNDVVESVLNIPKAFPEPPGKDVLKSYIVSRENDYLQGKNPGVSEESLVNYANYVSQKLGTPPSGRTNVVQVHEIRVRLAQEMPTFIKPSEKKMSPAQAVQVLTNLFNQKLLNPDFQVPPEKFNPKPSISTTPQNKTTASREFEQNKTPEEVHAMRRNSYALQKSVNDGIANMSLVDGADLAHRFMDLLQGKEN